VSQEQVRQYYAAYGENEWHRLTRPVGKVEFAITTHALQRHLPRSGRILDLGGGPGRYTIWLAERGYQVVLADLSPNLLDIARSKIAEAGVQSQIENVITCDATDLSRIENDAFDAVLCLGPFYHLVEMDDRRKAMRELARVLKPQGTTFIAFIPVYSFLRRTLSVQDERYHLSQPNFLERLMNEGVFLNDIPGRFSVGYGIRPQAIRPFLEEHGLRTVELLADTGFAASHGQDLEELAASDPQSYEQVMEVIIGTANDPSLLGASIHLLAVAQKRE
jgi:SAM-dependent methyltransferase